MKLVVSDFDLTFFDEHYDENIELINSFVKKGNLFTIIVCRYAYFISKIFEIMFRIL